MDEKGIQMGVGKRTLVLVDRDQKTVQQLENGNRELVTVIETVCADGTALRPSVIYKGQRRDFSWGRDNPCNARCACPFSEPWSIFLTSDHSISFSPNGWTDMELGMEWLKNDFEPETAARNTTNGWRLLILDGHNSHCTYGFISFSEQHRIIIICLPSHTTHCLQPCDVGVFGPLAASWKAIVNMASREEIKITKYNLLGYYHKARTRAFSPTTIQAAFRKTGIWPLNPQAIPDTAYAPALNTTTQAAQPLPAVLPALLREVCPNVITAGQPVAPMAGTSVDRVTAEPQKERTSIDSQAATAPTIKYMLVGLPSPIKRNASQQVYQIQVDRLRDFAKLAKAQMEADYAAKRLMDAENQRLRARLFDKAQTKTRKREGGGAARHMTSQENAEALAKADWEAHIAAAHKEVAPKLKCIREQLKRDEKMAIEKHKQEEKEACEAAKAKAKAFADAVKKIAQAQRQAKQALAQERKAAEVAKKRAIAETRQANVAARKQLAQEKRIAAQAAQARKRPQKWKGREALSDNETETSDGISETASESLPQTPVRRPRSKAKTTLRRTMRLTPVEPSTPSTPKVLIEVPSAAEKPTAVDCRRGSRPTRRRALPARFQP